MIRTERRIRLCIALIAVNLVFIWGNSLMTAEISQAFSDWVKGLLLGNVHGDTGGTGSGLLRKVAHFAEFGALGFLLTWLCGMLKKRPAWAVLWGVMAACVDETIQIFVPERGPGLKDVALDSAGVCAGMILCLIGYNLKQSRKLKIGG